MKKLDFVITLKRPDYKSIDTISLLMLLFAVGMFVYTAINDKAMLKINLIIIIALIIGCLISLLFFSKKNHLIYYGDTLLLIAAAWAFQPKWNIFFMILYLIAGLLEKQAKTPLKMNVDEDEIAFNSFPKKRSAWNELNNVLIKDGIITIDYKNNKLIQKEIQEEVNPEREKEFNEFCKKQIGGFTK